MAEYVALFPYSQRSMMRALTEQGYPAGTVCEAFDATAAERAELSGIGATCQPWEDV